MTINMGFSNYSQSILNYNHRMIRSGYLNWRSRGLAVKLPPAKKYTSKAKQRNSKTYRSNSLIKNIIVWTIIASIIALIIYLLASISIENYKVIIYKNPNATQDYLPNCNPDNIKINTTYISRIIDIGFYKLSIKQYSAAQLHFEGALLIDKNSKGANLGMAYAMTGLCKRDQLHCELSEQYIDHVLYTNLYSVSQIQFLKSFLANKNIDAYLYYNAS